MFRQAFRKLNLIGVGAVPLGLGSAITYNSHALCDTATTTTATTTITTTTTILDMQAGDGRTTVFGAASKDVMARVNPNVLTFLHADFCPFANRAWITLLEKETEPSKPVLFDEQMCCYFMGPKDPGTSILYDMDFRTVPAAIQYGQRFTESMELADYFDDLFPNAPLKPADPLMKYNMVQFMKSHGPLCSLYYRILRNQDKTKCPELQEKFEGMLEALNNDLGKFAGPYLCGEQFTLADIFIFGFIERTLIVLPYYKKYELPAKFTRILDWYEHVKVRPSIKVVTGERSVLSRSVMAFEAVDRKGYLIEMYECYANDEIPLAKNIHAKESRVGYNAYCAFKKTQMACC